MQELRNSVNMIIEQCMLMPEIKQGLQNLKIKNKEDIDDYYTNEDYQATKQIVAKRTNYLCSNVGA